MFSLDEKIRFWLCQHPVSMRYGIRGLTGLVLSWPGFSPMSGCAFVFFSADRRQVKILRWNTADNCIWLHIFCDYSSCRYNCIVAYCNSLQYGGV